MKLFAYVLSAVFFEEEQAESRCREEEERKLALPSDIQNTESHIQIIHLQNGVMSVAQEVITCKNECQ